MDGDPYFEAQALEVWLGERPVFSDLTLTLVRGEHTVVIGPNGSGKSSLVKLLSRELYPVVREGSSLRLFGESTINLWSLRQRIGHVSADLQADNNPGVLGMEVVLSGLFGSRGLGRSQGVTDGHRRAVAALMRQLDLTDLAQQPFGRLSDGQKRRLLLARALVHQPEVLVLDEPTNGLDLAARQQFLNGLRTLCRQGTTVLLITHQIDVIIPEISRAVLLQRGGVVADGPAEQWLRDRPLSELFGTPLTVMESCGWRQVLPSEALPRGTD